MRKQHKKLILTSIISACVIASPQILAHSKFTTTTAEEGVKVYNNISIGHGCTNPNPDKADKLAVIANSMVLPDSSGVVYIDGVQTSQPVTDFLSNWPGTFANVPSTDIFSRQEVILDSLGTSAIGKVSTIGKIPGNFNTGLLPFIITAPLITNKMASTSETPASQSPNCANTVTLYGSIADICKFTTTTSKLTTHTQNIWAAIVGSKYEGRGIDGLDNDLVNKPDGNPATFTITRKGTHTLDSSCGAGVVVVIKPTPTLLNQKLSIKGKWAEK